MKRRNIKQFSHMCLDGEWKSISFFVREEPIPKPLICGFCERNITNKGRLVRELKEQL